MSKRMFFRRIPCFAILILVFSFQLSHAQFWESSPLDISNLGQSASNSYVAWGNNFAVVWHQNNTIWFSRVDENGIIVQPPVAVYTPPEPLGGVCLRTVNTGNNFVTIFLVKSRGNTKLCSVCIKPDGTLKGQAKQIDITSTIFRGYVPAWTGSFVGLFYFKADDKNNLYFVSLNQDGSPTNTIKAIPVLKARKILYNMDVAWDGKYFGVAWVKDYRLLQFTRVKTNGKKKNKVNTIHSGRKKGSQHWVSILPYSKNKYAVSWTYNKTANGIPRPHFLRIGGNGAKIGQIVKLSKPNFRAYYLTMAFNKDNKRFALFWVDPRDVSQGQQFNIYGAKVSIGGNIVVNNVKLTSEVENVAHIDIANSGDAAILTWTKYMGNGSPSTIVTMKMISELW